MAQRKTVIEPAESSIGSRFDSSLVAMIAALLRRTSVAPRRRPITGRSSTGSEWMMYGLDDEHPFSCVFSEERSVREDRRSEKRFRRLEAAHALQAGPRRTFDCILRDISEHGCRLVGVGIDTIRSPFLLVLPGNGRTRRCEVAWRARKSIGVHFLRSPPTEE
jgi:hypothetical protein